MEKLEYARARPSPIWLEAKSFHSPKAFMNIGASISKLKQKQK
jgi:hypothetical protein